MEELGDTPTKDSQDSYPTRDPMPKKKTTTTTTSTTAATYEADLLAEPNTPYLIQNLVTWRERERESPYNLRGNNKVVVP